MNDSDTPTEGEVFLSEAPYLRRTFDGSRPFPSLEWKGDRQLIGWKQLPPEHGRVRRAPIWKERTNEEMLAAEAEIFMLLNGGGTDQDPEHMAKVARMVK